MNSKPQQYGSIEVTPIFTPSQGFHRMPSVSSMISQPMKNPNTPNWHRNQFSVQENGSDIDQSSFFAMSSFLDRSVETPAPIPLECTLGAETPSPSLPSNTPPNDESPRDNSKLFDTSDFLRITFQDDIVDQNTGYFRTPLKRHRRTKAEINAAKLEELKKI